MSATAAPSNKSENGEQVTLPGLARALIQRQLLRLDQAVAIQQKVQGNAETRFIDELVSSGTMPAPKLALFLSENFGMPLFDVTTLDREILQSDLIDKKLLAETRIIPLIKRGNRLAVLTSDPTDQTALDRVKFKQQATVDPIIVEHDKLLKLIEKLGQSAADKLADLAGEDLGVDVAGDGFAAIEDSSEVDDAPIVKFLTKVLMDAIQAGASDLHFEPYEKYYRIRFRIDGELREMAQPPLVIKDKLSSRIKVISKLDISEKRIPQDGRMKLVLSASRAIDFRVSTLPTLFGEKIVMRILDPSQAKLGIDALGYDPDQKELLLAAVQRPYGMVLVTGPTGSGKTVSLYTCLNILNKPGVNISTAEDPAEINLPGINQVNVNDKAGLTFAAALKSFLRQDPDVIMVGEIRDLETAEIAIKAAQTGHMVLSTLHTNDAPQTIARLMNMGIAPYNITSSVTLVIAQRLARRLCSKCRKPQELPVNALLAEGFTQAEIDAGFTLYQAVGCDDCTEGYKGRTGIYQVMPMSDEIQAIVLAGGNAMQIAEVAQQAGVRDLRQSALMKARNGITSLAEINRVTKD